MTKRQLLSLLSLTLLLLAACTTGYSAAEDAAAQAPPSATISSPDGRIVVTVTTNERAEPHYSVRFNNQYVIRDSRLGLRFAEQAGFDQGFVLSAQRSASHDASWEQPWGERRVIRDRHNELAVSFSASQPERRPTRGSDRC